MNKIFKVIWNPATGSYSVASETAKSRGKKSGRSKLLISALVVGGLLSSGAHAEVALDGGKSAEATPLSNGWIAIGFGAIATSAQTGPSGGSNTSSVAIGQSAFSGVGGTSLGFSSNASGERSVALGQATVATGSRAIAIGSAAQATKEYSLALGNSAHANGDYATAIGKDSEANGLHSLAIGQASEATKAGSVAMGYNSQSNGTGAVALGQDSFVSGNDSAALGNGARTSGNNSVALGAGALAAEDNVISVGNNTDQRKIVFVDKGIINKTSTDAVNGSQIFALSQSVANRLGGNASVNAADGTVNAPTYTISSGTYNNVGDALDAVNSTINTTNTAVTDLKDDSLLWDGTAFSAKHGTSTTNKITNVMAGSLSDTSTDAVNGSQLKTTNDNVATNTTNITNLTNDVADINTTITGLEDDALQWNGTAFSAKHGTNTTSKITNVMAGSLSDTSTDAVNGSQLKTTNDNVTTNTTNITNLTNDVADINTTITGLEDDALQWNGTAFSAKHGTNTTSKITNVMAGDLSGTSTDAVNGSQLKATNDNVTTNTTNITNLTNDVADINTTITGLEDDALQWNGTAFSAKHGTNTTSKITNVMAGDLSDTSTDAVNGAQLKTTNDNVTTNTTNITNLTNDVADINTTITGLEDDALQWNGTAFSAKHGTNTTSKITNVMAGDLSDTSTDAVNGSQLKTTNDNVATNTTNITNLTNDVADINTTITGLEDDALQWNGTAFSAKHGTNTTNKITNVMAGDLSDTSTDAVNGSQLKTTNDNVATNTTNITNLTNDVADINTTITGLEDDSLQWNGTAFSAKHGTSTTNKITNVMAGDLSDTSTDAVNGSQLKTTNDNVATNTTNITNLTNDVADINTTITGLEDDSLQWNGTAFSAKHGTSTTNKIINVAAGTLSSSSTDAVNGGQLYGLSSSIANYLGGNASVDSSGVFTGPTYNIGGTDYDNVGEALAAIDSSVVASLGDALAWDAKTGTFTASHGGSASKITNVAAGSISKDSADAVNGGQLYDVSNSISDILGGGSTVNADGTINAPAYTIANTDYDNVGDALSAIDSTLDDAMIWDDNAGAFSAAHDGDTTSKITNVKAGNVAVDSTDAVNGSQLYATNVLINQNSDMINQLAGDTSTTYIEEHGAGVNYVRTNDTGLTFIDASAAGVGSTALGYNATASGENSLAIGRDSVSSIDSGIALGSGSTSDRVIVKGSRSGSVTENGVVIGYDTTDGELLGALSVGKDGESYRQIINVADGSEAHDVVTVRQLQNAIGSVASTPAKYFHSNSKEEDSLAVGTDSLAMGAKTVVNGDAGIGIGFGSLVVQDAINGIAIGSSARANHANSIAMGNGSQTTVGAQSNYTAYNMDAPQNSVGEFSVGSTNGQRQITNVAAGSQDTDAVNVGQLKVTDARVEINTTSINNLNNQVSNLDTRVTNIENGIGDIVTTGSTKYFKANTTGADANAQGADSVAIGSGSIAAADNSVALGTGSIADETNTISVGSSTNQRRITNVAAGKNDTDAVNVAQLKSSTEGGVRYSTNEDGTINYSTLNLGDGKGGTTQISNVSAAVNDHDAVNYAQLKQSIQDTNSYTDQKMVEMDNKVKGVEKKMSGGIASAMAMTGLPQAYTPGASMASIGGGTYNGESAVALGVSMVSANGRWVYKLQGSTNSQGEYSAALGAGIQW
ncbi:YadA-like family protein [Escherichia marmotae]|uniref:YadA-like family protein n=6 Tax=Escherichia marmotae TaxID=1499973 RepID=UPI00076F20A2|nr:YadA-like family protein [Escherichia marmotae]WGY64729.1 YadA-like family protein [Escherichia marmotae]